MSDCVDVDVIISCAALGGDWLTGVLCLSG